MKKTPSLLLALLPLAIMILCLVAGSQIMPLSPPLLVPVMLLAAAFAGWLAIRCGHTFGEIQMATGKKLADVLPMLLILLGIGMLIGCWMVSGTIPLMIYVGLQLVNPHYMLLTAFLVTAMMSLATGTSFGSAGTVGVALMGMAGASGVPLPACAGAVLSGAYFGDKMSPLSDTTNISALGAGADLYAHIRHMLYTATPSFLLACLVYAIAGFSLHIESTHTSGASRLMEDIPRAFQLNGWTLLPPAIVVIGIVRKVPPVLAMSLSSLAAILVAVTVHGFSLPDALTSAVEGFNVSMVASLGLEPQSFGSAFVKLVNRGGLYSMVGNFVVIIAAFTLAAGMDVSGALDLIIKKMLAAAKGVFGLIAATMASGFTMIGLTSHGGVTALVIGGLFQDAFAKRGLAPQNLSRSLEDSVTITEPLMPWTVSAIFMATTLGVPTWDYLPWATFCYSGTFFSLLIAATYKYTGFGILKMKGQPIP